MIINKEQEKAYKDCLWLIENSNLTYADAAGAAAYVNHKKLLDYSLNQIKPLRTVRYNIITANAANGGHKELTFALIKEIQPPNTVDYNLITANAANGGHKDLAFALIATIQPPNTVDYNQIAAGAANGGHKELTFALMKEIQPLNTVNYNRIAAWAAKGGHKDLADKIKKAGLTPHSMPSVTSPMPSAIRKRPSENNLGQRPDQAKRPRMRCSEASNTSPNFFWIQ